MFLGTLQSNSVYFNNYRFKNKNEYFCRYSVRECEH